MRNFAKKLTASLLVLLLIFAALPVTALAAGNSSMTVKIVYVNGSQVENGPTFSRHSFSCKKNNHGGNHPVGDNCEVSCKDFHPSKLSGFQAKSGYEFDGWMLGDYARNKTENEAFSRNANTKTKLNGNPNGTVTLIFRPASVKYTLSFNANFGGLQYTVPQALSSTTNTGSATFTIPNVTPVHVHGMNFLGWSKSAFAETAEYKAGDSITITTDTMLFAIWGEVSVPTYTYTLNFNANGGQNAPAAMTEADTTATSHTFNLSGVAAPTRDGHTFKGWAYSATATATDCVSSVTLTSNVATMTVYAVWEEVPVPTYTYTLNFNANGGQNAPAALTETDTTATSHTFNLSSVAAPTREGYTFKGWAPSANATAADCVSSVTLNPNANTKTVYAVWEQNAPVEPPHTHTPSNWITNTTHHWRLLCTDPNCPGTATRNTVITDYGPHVYTDNRDPDCNTCGYERELPDNNSPATGDITNIPMWGLLLFGGIALMYVQLTQRKREQF